MQQFSVYKFNKSFFKSQHARLLLILTVLLALLKIKVLYISKVNICTVIRPHRTGYRCFQSSFFTLLGE